MAVAAAECDVQWKPDRSAMTFNYRSSFSLTLSSPASFSSRENSDCHNATGSHQEHDIAPVRGTEVLVRISGFAPQLDPQSMNHSTTTNKYLKLYMSTIDNTSNSSGRKNNWVLWDRLNCSAGGGGRLKVLDLRYCRGSLQGLRAPGETHG